jgi:VIT1/CCC1 family predicted Fe2+/Mn2+ transporter
MDTQGKRLAEHSERAKPKNKALRVVAGIAASFTVLVGTIIFLMVREVISAAMASLMLVALLAMYVGFGVLIAVYRLVDKLK